MIAQEASEDEIRDADQMPRGGRGPADEHVERVRHAINAKPPKIAVGVVIRALHCGGGLS